MIRNLAIHSCRVHVSGLHVGLLLHPDNVCFVYILYKMWYCY